MLRAVGSASRRLYEAKEAEWVQGYKSAHQAVFYNATNVMSLADRHMRDSCFHQPRTLEHRRKMLATRDRYRDYITSGSGLWWAQAAKHRAIMMGEPIADDVAAVLDQSEIDLKQAAAEINAALTKKESSK